MRVVRRCLTGVVASGVFAVDRGPGAVGQGQEILLYNTANGIEGRITDPIDGMGVGIFHHSH